MKMTETAKWMRRLKKVLADCPEGHWIFVDGEGVYLMRYGPDGKRILMGTSGAGCMSMEAIVESISLSNPDMPEMDGGAW